MEHDNSYKLLFSEPEIVADLLKGFVDEPWVKYLDFSTLEKMPTHCITDDLRDREDDVIWRVKCKNEWLYIYLLIEFQSTVDYFMAVRLMTYIGLLYQDLIKQFKLGKNDKLPPVFPVVLYNGKPRWTAATELNQLIQDLPTGFNKYKPSLRYLTLDEGRYSETELKPLKNLVAAIFRLENSTTEIDIINVIDDLIKWLVAPEQNNTRRVFNIWIKRVLLKSNKIKQPVDNLINLTEVRKMFAENVANWHVKWENKGIKKGIEQGIKQGIEQNHLKMINRERQLFNRMINKRFGENTATLALKLLNQFNENDLDKLGDIFIDSNSSQTLLENMQRLINNNLH